MSTFSIITPTKDKAQFLVRAIESVLTQDVDAIEYIVVDGCSSDGSLKLLSDFDQRLNVATVSNGDLAAAVNAGLERASGEVIGWLNSDDIYFPGALAAVGEYLDQHPEVDVVYGNAHYVDEDDDVIDRYPVRKWNRKRLNQGCFLCQPAVFFTRRVLESVGYLDPDLYYHPDYEFWLRLDQAGATFGHIDQVLAGRRRHAGNERAESGDPQAFLESIHTLQKLRGRVPARWFLRLGSQRAEAKGITRESKGYDRMVLRFALEAFNDTTLTGKRLGNLKVAGRHWYRELNAMLERPYRASRLLPSPLHDAVQRFARRKLFRLRNHSPRPLRTTSNTREIALQSDTATISIVTPSLNQGQFLEHTLNSVLQQNYPRLEYIVQDGGSTDQSVEIIRRYEDRLSSWQSEQDDGQASAINMGMQRTTGEIMAYLNSDDLLLPGSLAFVADFFRGHPEVDVLYGHRVLIDGDGREVGRWVLPAHDDRAIAWADYIPQETLFWRRSAWEAIGGRLDESFRFAMDWDLILRFREAELRFARAPRFLGAFRVTEDQKTSRLMETTGRLEMKRLHRRELGKIPTRREVRRAVKPYMRRHWWYDKLYTLGLVRY